jgi:hypothetical protein
MQEVGEEENMKMEHRLSYLALIGTISPMVGLFGTVHGMIASFQVIARGGATPKPSELAQGISTALMTTLVGLAIAIPAIAAYNILRNRVAQLGPGSRHPQRGIDGAFSGTAVSGRRVYRAHDMEACRRSNAVIQVRRLRPNGHRAREHAYQEGRASHS